MNSRSLEEVLNKMNDAEHAAEKKVVEQPSPGAEGLVFEEHKLEVSAKAAEPAPVASAEKTAPDASESMADSNAADGGATELPSNGIPAKVWSTYVPRFTEVSDEYRLKRDKRFRDKLAEKKESDEKDGSVDPTAEIEEEYEDVGLNMYKYYTYRMLGDG